MDNGLSCECWLCGETRKARNTRPIRVDGKVVRQCKCCESPDGSDVGERILSLVCEGTDRVDTVFAVLGASGCAFPSFDAFKASLSGLGFKLEGVTVTLA